MGEGMYFMAVGSYRTDENPDRSVDFEPNCIDEVDCMPNRVHNQTWFHIPQSLNIIPLYNILIVQDFGIYSVFRNFLR